MPYVCELCYFCKLKTLLKTSSKGLRFVSYVTSVSLKRLIRSFDMRQYRLVFTFVSKVINKYPYEYILGT